MENVDFEEIRNRRFSGERVRMDGKRFVECHFKGCVLDFGATAPFTIDDQSSLTDIQWHLSDNAGGTIHVMKLMWGMGHHDTIDQIFQYITGRGLADLPHVRSID